MKRYMDILQEAKDVHRKSFFSHVFSTSEESKAEVLNVVQYACLGVIPIVILNKLIQRFVPEADSEKSTLELLVEIFIQLIVMFCGIIVIHRIVSYVPTYSGFKYENLTLTNSILAFLIIVLSIQTKLGIKVNILVDRVSELWNGPQDKPAQKQSRASSHAPSQADYLDRTQLLPSSSHLTQMPAAAPVRQQPDYNMVGQQFMAPEPSAANEMGGSWSSW
jgi:hypothetical protein